MTQQLHPLAHNFEELFALLRTQQETLNLVAKLLFTDSMKFVSKSVRDDLAHKLMHTLSEIEDSTRAIVKGVRAVKRQRFTNDVQISNLFMNVADITAVSQLDYGQLKFVIEAYPNISQLLDNTPAQVRELVRAQEEAPATEPTKA